MASRGTAGWTALRGFLRTLWRIARQVFHEATGALFLVLALFGATSAWRAWQRGTPAWLVGVSAGYALMMIYFGATSFRNARRIR